MNAAATATASASASAAGETSRIRRIRRGRRLILLVPLSYLSVFSTRASAFIHPTKRLLPDVHVRSLSVDLHQVREDGVENHSTSSSTFLTTVAAAKATPTLPSGSFRPKQSLGQNFLKDGNTVQKIIKAFFQDASKTFHFQNNPKLISQPSTTTIRAVELGPGAGALTDSLVSYFPNEQQQQQQQQSKSRGTLQCIEIDSRSVQLLTDKHPHLHVRHMDVLQVDYPLLAQEQNGPLCIIGNLPYYITSQILFTLADASHANAIQSATVTMQYEVAQRIVAQPHTKEYGILSVVFQLYAQVHFHFKIPPTVFYPQPKVDSALVGFHFYGPTYLQSQVFTSISPKQLRRVLSTSFQQRRKTLRNSLKKLVLELCRQDVEWTHRVFSMPCHNISSSLKHLPPNWATLRPEQLTPMQFVALTEMLYQGRFQCSPPSSSSADTRILNTGETEEDGEEGRGHDIEEEDDIEEEVVVKDDKGVILGTKVWRRFKHGANDSLF